jgi:hypothetical protein
MITLPTLSDGTAYYRLRTTLDGAEYVLDFAWGVLESRWYLTLYDSTGVLLCGPMKILPLRSLLSPYHGRLDVPSGDLVVYLSTASDVSPPGLYDLGPDKRVQLVYQPGVG